MKRLYIFLFLFAIGFTACNSSADSTETNHESTTEETAQDVDTSKDNVSASSADYETVVITANIASPRKEMTASISDQTIKVNYGSPSVKGRTLFGDLEPYDEVWRTGANEATTFEVSSDVKVQGKTLAAGKYGLFTIPKKDANWTVIFNSVADQWGAYKYEASKDVLRVEATIENREEASETMEFVIEDGNLVWKWDKLALPIPLEF